ncbi:hypothetical protein [Methanobrevibacter arboriphilus]|uniref:Uncharacterized protein n=1 Tax=Methanobrevibacter arboriphilus TaxID=39441 RepID=A0ACA8R0N7_METAZ|nr:hypothetical protein [Methanobrevibacter arboriphilus]BBL61015.1 hypothetical protein MarbSA_00550 [Methanobrevibacter arboriphilus]
MSALITAFLAFMGVYFTNYQNKKNLEEERERYDNELKIAKKKERLEKRRNNNNMLMLSQYSDNKKILIYLYQLLLDLESYYIVTKGFFAHGTNLENWRERCIDADNELLSIINDLMSVKNHILGIYLDETVYSPLTDKVIITDGSIKEKLDNINNEIENRMSRNIDTSEYEYVFKMIEPSMDKIKELQLLVVKKLRSI